MPPALGHHRVLPLPQARPRARLPGSGSAGSAAAARAGRGGAGGAAAEGTEGGRTAEDGTGGDAR